MKRFAVLFSLLLVSPLWAQTSAEITGQAQTAAVTTAGALTASGPVAEEDVTTYAADLSRATSEYLSIADNPTLRAGDTDFSFVLWFKPETNAAFQHVVTKFKAAGHEREYLLEYMGGAGGLVKWWVSHDGQFLQSVLSTAPLVVGNWNFIYVYHEDGVNIGVSIDDSAIDVTVHAAGVFEGTAAYHIGGTDPYNSTYGANGTMALVGFYRRKLPAGEVTAIYAAGPNLQYADLTAAEKANLEVWWDLEEAEGAQRNDSHGANHLTDNNTVGQAEVVYP